MHAYISYLSYLLYMAWSGSSTGVGHREGAFGSIGADALTEVTGLIGFILGQQRV